VIIEQGPEPLELVPGGLRQADAVQLIEPR
jgi:hypothetical protein